MKTLTFIAGVFCALTLSTPEMNAQQSHLTQSTLVSARMDFEGLKKAINTPSRVSYQPFYIDESDFGIKAVKSFGSFVIPTTNFLKIVAPDDNVYTKAQLINKKTSDSVFSIKLDGTNDTVDMTNTKAGLYILTMSNELGDIYSEEIMIM